MSIRVGLDDLAATIAGYGWAYVLTVREDATPQIVATVPEWADGEARITAGRGTVRNAGQRPSITLCYPPVEPGDYSLIVDGTATIKDDESLTFGPTSAVLHRSAV